LIFEGMKKKWLNPFVSYYEYSEKIYFHTLYTVGMVRKDLFYIHRVIIGDAIEILIKMGNALL